MFSYIHANGSAKVHTVGLMSLNGIHRNQKADPAKYTQQFTLIILRCSNAGKGTLT
jgi:hypothetical protein